jgi:hypothetical protein
MLDASTAEVREGVGRLRRAKDTGAVGSSTVVVANVLREHSVQVPLVEDQHAVREFGSKGADEPFGDTVRARAARRNPDHADAHIGQDGIEGRGELAGPIPDEELELGEAIAEIPHEVTDPLSGPSTVGLMVAPRRCTNRPATSSTKNTEIHWSITAQST